MDKSKGIVGMPMPKRYVIEMFCDRVAACKIYQKDNYDKKNPLEYYMKGRAGKLLHEDTKKLLEKYLHMCAEKGEDFTFRYIKNKEVIPMRRDILSRIVAFFLRIKESLKIRTGKVDK